MRTKKIITLEHCSLNYNKFNYFRKLENPKKNRMSDVNWISTMISLQPSHQEWGNRGNIPQALGLWGPKYTQNILESSPGTNKLVGMQVWWTRSWDNVGTLRCLIVGGGGVFPAEDNDQKTYTREV